MQKTAYEMRSCDLSSDVCSSDLDDRQPVRVGGKVMPFDLPDISKNQLMQVGLGLLGSGFGRGQTNPFMAAGQGLVYGQQQDKADAEEQRIQPAREREERLNQAWLGMFNQGQPSSSSSDMARAGKIGRAQVCTPVTHAHLVCRLLLE